MPTETMKSSLLPLGHKLGGVGLIIAAFPCSRRQRGNSTKGNSCAKVIMVDADMNHKTAFSGSISMLT